MNSIRKSFSKILSINFLFLIGVLLGTQGCATSDHAVLAATGTVIGVELSQNPATQVPQGKLGYNRAEFAYVPTNRNKSDEAGQSGNGAADTAEVLMEIKYSDIFSSGSGIYQRLAVGKTAVSQAGAAYMFARDAEGKISPETAAALKNIKGIPATNPKAIFGKAPIRICHDESPAKKDAVEKAVTGSGFSSYEDFISNKNVTQEQINDITKKIENDCNFG
jgi:hypothetical protein